MKKINIELKGVCLLDSIRYNLQQQLTTKELIVFAHSLGEKLAEDENFYINLEDKCRQSYNKLIPRVNR